VAQSGGRIQRILIASGTDSVDQAAGAPTVHVPRSVYEAFSLDEAEVVFGWVHENGVSIACGGPEADGGSSIGLSVPGAFADGAPQVSLSWGTVLVDPSSGRAAIADCASGDDVLWPARLVIYDDAECFRRNHGLVAAEAVTERHVVLIGAGSVASEIGCDLARQGVGRITIIDFDTVDPVNMSRTSLDRSDIGAPKVNALRRHLLRYNPGLRVDAVPLPAEAPEVAFERLVAEADVVVCAADSRGTRKFVNGVCVALGVPLVLVGFHERAECCDVIWVASPVTPCLRCIYPADETDSAGRPDVPYATSESTEIGNGLVIDIGLGNALASGIILPFVDPSGAGRDEILDPAHNRLLIHSGRVPQGDWVDVFQGPFDVVAFTHERDENCPHCGSTTEARAYRSRVRERGGVPEPSTASRGEQ